MKIILQIISVTGLLLVLVPSLLHFAGIIDFEKVKMLMLIGTGLWFGSAIFWLGRKKPQE